MTSVAVGHPRTARHNTSPQEVESRLRGRVVQSVGRHGKLLIIDLDDGCTLVAHLGMSGRFEVADGAEEPPPHTHFVARLDNGTEIRFIDPRTFGYVGVFDEDEMPLLSLSRLGPDAWESPPDTGQLEQRLRRRTAPIKAVLLDQGPLAGLGNIYADEVLFRARIHPLTPAGDLTVDRLGDLLSSIRTVLDEAIESGGTTLGDLAYLLPDGRAGENLSRLAVYGRQGEPCTVCATPVERVIVRGRSTHFCPGCQRSGVWSRR